MIRWVRQRWHGRFGHPYGLPKIGVWPDWPAKHPARLSIWVECSCGTIRTRYLDDILPLLHGWAHKYHVDPKEGDVESCRGSWLVM